MTTIDLTQPTSIHIIGVGGAGMSAIAEVLVAMGHAVTGSDLKGSSSLERLRALGVEVAVGHDPANIGGAAVVAVSTAIPERNVELISARERGLVVLSRAEILTAITRTRQTVAVAGTHGKTTTSSMLALVLREAGLAPSFIIGGDVNEIGSGAVWDTGELLVVEADESDGTFLDLVSDAAIVTSVEPDHIEHYGGEEALRQAFVEFVDACAGPVVVCADDPGAVQLAGLGVTTYGTSEDADYRMVDAEGTGHGSTFVLWHEENELGTVRLPVPGLHNAQNGCGALVMAMRLGASFEAGATALSRFAGVARRFQFRGERGGVTFVDDYAHLPTEVMAALAAANDGDWDRVVCVFQPHRYSRTAALWEGFADAFAGADQLVVTDVYASGEAPRPGVSGRLIVNAVLDARPWADVVYLPKRADLMAYLPTRLRAGDLCLTLGAGDLTSLPDQIIEDIA